MISTPFSGFMKVFLNLNFNIIHFGVQKLNELRKQINEIIIYFNNKNIIFYSIKTDFEHSDFIFSELNFNHSIFQ